MKTIETVELPTANLEIYEAETFFKNVLDGVNPGLSADEGELSRLDDMPQDPTAALFAKAEEKHLNKLSPFRLAHAPAVVKVERPLSAAEEVAYQKGFEQIIKKSIERISAKLEEKFMKLAK